MFLYHIVILALVQGITEFLPVSSSGHLVLTHAVFGSNGWQEDLTMDIAVHVGTLLAVLLFFRKDIAAMFRGVPHLLKSPQKPGEEGRLLGMVLIASLPVIAAGFILNLWEPEWLRSPLTIAITTIVFGILLWWADQKPDDKELPALNGKQALFIGISQILALIPGTSRSGITMTAARYLGYSRVEAARFSLLLAIIAISGAGTLIGIELWVSQNMTLTLDALLAVAIAFVAGWVSIALMLRWLEKATFTPFAVYRLILGVILLILVYKDIL